MRKGDIIITIAVVINLLCLYFISKINLIISISILIIYLLSLFLFNNIELKRKINKYLTISLSVFNSISFLINQLNILDYIGSVHEIKNFILSTHEWGIVAFILIELLDVLVLPIPSFVIILAGVNIWGVTKTILVCGITVIIGSCISFLIGKFWGAKAINNIVGQKRYSEYKQILDKHDKLYLTLMFIFPFFPDDLICLLAGTTNMKLYEFFIISLITRPLSIILTAYLGEYILSIFENNSLSTIIITIFIVGISVYLITKYKEKIIEFWKSKIKKKSS